MARKFIVSGRVYEATAERKVIVSGTVFQEDVAVAPSAWTGIVNGVTNPPFINGIAVAGINEVAST